MRRFDRDGNKRIHYASAKTLLNAADGGDGSYLDLALMIGMSGSAGSIDADLEQLYRRVVFNILIGNRDDHLRNHGFLREGNGWRLSPAFDVNPNPHKDVHVLGIIEGDRTPTTALVAASHKHYALSKQRASSVIAEVRSAVAQWVQEARRAGARRAEISGMQAVIDPQR